MRASLVPGFRLILTGAVLSLGLVPALPLVAAERDARGGPRPERSSPTSPDWTRNVAEQIRRAEYRIAWQGRTGIEEHPQAWQAPNREQGFRSTFTDSGVRVAPRVATDAPQWLLVLDVESFGRGESRQPAAVESRRVNDNRVEVERPGIREWFVNTPEGLEHGFDLDAPPPGPPGPVHIDLALTGGLVPRLSDDGAAVDLLDGRGARVLRYAGLVVRDVSGRELPSSMRVLARGELRGIRLTFDDRSATYPVTVDPLLTSPVWTVEGDRNLASLGASIAGAGDVNADGFVDVVVGAPGYDNGQDEEGLILVYPGTASGPGTTPVFAFESDQVGARLGSAVATAGDVNDDGFADIVAGAPAYDDTLIDEGRAYVFLGSALGLSAPPAWEESSAVAGARFGAAVSSGDVNGDGFSDLVIGAPDYSNVEVGEGAIWVYAGGPGGLSTTPLSIVESDLASSSFGTAVAVAGDVDGDTFSDVVVGAPGFTNGENEEGAMLFYLGSAGGVVTPEQRFIESDQFDARYGDAVAGAGDVNGDGYADVLVGSPVYNAGINDRGRAFLYLGGATGIGPSEDWFADGSQAGSRLATSLCTAGDVNGDGFADVVVGEPLRGLSNQGSISVYFGSSSGLSATVGARYDGDQDFARLGSSVGAGDLNGDGLSDVLAGAPFYNNAATLAGRASAFLGERAGPAEAVGWFVEGTEPVGGLGVAVSTAGDVNGDGYADVLVGAFQFDNGAVDEGQAYVFHGSATGPSLVPDWIGDGEQFEAKFGTSVASAGDVNGDGYDDIVVGAPGFSNGEPTEGAAFVFHGSDTGLSAVPDWSAESDQFFSDFGSSVSSAGDVNGDGYADIVVGAFSFDGAATDDGRAFVFHGSAGGLSAAPDWIADGGQDDAEFGYSVAGAGDIDGDGDTEILVGARDFDAGNGAEGRVLVYAGSFGGLSLTPDWNLGLGVPGAQFGHAVSTAGDTDGDGFADILIGARSYTNGEQDEGLVALFRGSASGPSTTPDWSIEADQPFAALGSAVGLAGDVNGDGFADVIVGAPLSNNGSSDEGHAALYLGSAGGVATQPAWTGESNQNLGRYGRSVSGAGDVNGDGYADLVIGSGFFDGGAQDVGRAYVYYGNGAPGRPLNPVQRRADDSGPIARGGLAEASDTFRLGVTGTSPFGRAPVYARWEVKPVGTPFDGTGTQTSAAPIDSGLTGAVLNDLITGLAPRTDYHWRGRLVYEPTTSPLLVAGPWFTMPWNGASELDLQLSCVDGDDVDADGFCSSDNDCDDAIAETFPGAPEVCDGLRNDCSDSLWPQILDADLDLTEDLCDTCTDTDGDTFGDPGFVANTCDEDNCPDIPNAGQEDGDSDGIGDPCDPCPIDPDNDIDADGFCADEDNCPVDTNAGQEDSDSDGPGDACDTCTDIDGDGFGDPGFDARTCPLDNCPATVNPGQEDADGDLIGDVCDPCPNDPDNDLDGDTVCGDVDNCPAIANPLQADTDSDLLGDVCDPCTDTDGDSLGNPGFPANTCPDDNCADVANPGQENDDGDAFGDVCDECPADPDNDLDADTVCGDVDNCPVDANLDQADNDEDGAGDVCDLDDDDDGIEDLLDNCPLDDNALQADGDGDLVGDVCDNCPGDANFDQADLDGDGIGEVCDLCIDADGDGFGDPDQIGNTCPPDSCPDRPNPDQADADLDGIADVCDPCPFDPDSDGDGVCDDRRQPVAGYPGEQIAVGYGADDDTVLIAADSSMRYLANAADPMLVTDWFDPSFDDAAWTAGVYGVGYEAFGGAENLIETTVPTDTVSIYTRATFVVDSVASVESLWFGADYDDGIVVWINGLEVYRSPNMPAGAPAWDADPPSRESSNGSSPNYEPQFDISATGIGALVDGENLIAVGVYNDLPGGSPSSDLVVVPRLSVNRVPTMRYLPNPSDPGIGLDWVEESFDDATWDEGWYGVGYETAQGAEKLVQSEVASNSYSIYTRARFVIDNVYELRDLFLGVDYDDGVVAWINGVEVYRSPNMGASVPVWNRNVASHESSNGRYPDFGSLIDLTSTGLPLLRTGENLLAVGVWNNGAPVSSDLVVVPQLSYNRAVPEAISYLANAADPTIGLDWVQPSFNDTAWNRGSYGIGFETDNSGTGARDLLATEVPSTSISVYTRAIFEVDDASAIRVVELGADYDDGWIAWINGVEVYRSPEMPVGAPSWDTRPAIHESSNGPVPEDTPLIDVSGAALAALVDGPNLLAVGVWNGMDPLDDDLVIVPRLSLNGDQPDNCPLDANADQLDTDEDGEGDRCDLDDGLLQFEQLTATDQTWQTDTSFVTYNLYRGDLAVLHATGVYTQDVAAPNVDRFCGLPSAMYADAYVPPSDEGVFYLVSGNDGVSEGSLGRDSSGVERVNDAPCP